MSDPVVLYSALLQAMRAEDDSVTLALFAPDFTAYEDEGLPYGGVYKGGENFLKLRKKVRETWGPGCLELLFKTGEADGNHATAYFRVTDKRPGAAPFETFASLVWTFRDGLATEVRIFYYNTPRIAEVLAGGAA